MAEPTYEDLRAALVNAEARIEERTGRILKMDRELVETRTKCRAATDEADRLRAEMDRAQQEAAKAQPMPSYRVALETRDQAWKETRALRAEVEALRVERDEARMHADVLGSMEVTGDGAKFINETVLKQAEADTASLAAAQNRIEGLAAILTELLRLYDWRFTLAEREKDQRNASEKVFRIETRRLLNQYGAEKKAAWEAARIALSSPVALPKEEVAPNIICPKCKKILREHCKGMGPHVLCCDGNCPAPLPEEQLPKEGVATAPAPGDAEMEAHRILAALYAPTEHGPAHASEARAIIKAELARVRSEERESIAAWHDGWARECARIAEREHAAERHFNGTSCEAYRRLHEEAAATIRARATSAGGGDK